MNNLTKLKNYKPLLMKVENKKIIRFHPTVNQGTESSTAEQFLNCKCKENVEYIDVRMYKKASEISAEDYLTLLEKKNHPLIDYSDWKRNESLESYLMSVADEAANLKAVNCNIVGLNSAGSPISKFSDYNIFPRQLNRDRNLAAMFADLLFLGKDKYKELTNKLKANTNLSVAFKAQTQSNAQPIAVDNNLHLMLLDLYEDTIIGTPNYCVGRYTKELFEDNTEIIEKIKKHLHHMNVEVLYARRCFLSTKAAFAKADFAVYTPDCKQICKLISAAETIDKDIDPFIIIDKTNPVPVGYYPITESRAIMYFGRGYLIKLMIDNCPETTFHIAIALPEDVKEMVSKYMPGKEEWIRDDIDLFYVSNSKWCERNLSPHKQEGNDFQSVLAKSCSLREWIIGSMAYELTVIGKTKLESIAVIRGQDFSVAQTALDSYFVSMENLENNQKKAREAEKIIIIDKVKIEE